MGCNKSDFPTSHVAVLNVTSCKGSFVSHKNFRKYSAPLPTENLESGNFDASGVKLLLYQRFV